MSAYLESFRAALTSLAAHRMRSFLTTLGILIGTASVIAVVALLQGLSDSVKSQFSEMGSNALTLQAVNDFDDSRTGKLHVLRMQDVDTLRYRVPGVTHVAPQMVVPAAGVSYRGRTATPMIQATTADYVLANNRFPQYGRFIVDSDDKGHRRVAVLGQQLRDDLKMPRNPVGEYIRIGKEWFKVVGMMEKQGELLGFSLDNYAVIPFDVGHAMLGNSSEPQISVTFNAANLEEVDALKERVRRAIRQSRRIESSKDDDFKIEAADSFIKGFNNFTSIATAVVAGVVGISLLVGGIGIMNIMLVSVTERTREIGILKALGATRRDIMVQFLCEAGLLALLGGLIGIGLGYGLAAMIAAMVPGLPPAHAPLWVVFAAAGFSALVGVVFGIMPASKAAGLDPIEALRYE